MLMARIAFRNIFRQKRRSILTALTMSGGLVLLSLSIAISEGTYGRMIEVFTRMHTGHIQIHKKDYLDKRSLYNTIEYPGDISQKLSSIEGVKHFSPRLYAPAMAFIEKKTTGAQIIGIIPEAEQTATTLEKTVTEGSFLKATSINGVIVGSGIAEILSAKVGDELILIGQSADGSIANDIFNIVGIIGNSNNTSDRMNCYMNLKRAQEFLVLNDQIHEIAVIVKGYKASFAMSAIIENALNNETLDVEPWQEVERQFYKAMRADIRGMWITLFIIMVIVAIGVLNTVLMTIMERTREFGVLKALGTRPVNVLKLIVLETTFLAILSSLIGLVFSVFINYLFSIYGIDYPEPVEVGGILISKMQASLTFNSFIIPFIITIGTAVLVSILPALKAAHVVPVDAMRTH